MIYAMKRLFIIAGCTLLCTLCGTFTTEAFAQSANQKDLKSYNQEQRAQRRAQRLADMEKYIDSIVLSRNFEFNPQTIQQRHMVPCSHTVHQFLLFFCQIKPMSTDRIMVT